MFGSAAGFAASLDLTALDGTDGFRLVGGGYDDFSGFSVAGAGDINGDGIDDLTIGAPGSFGLYEAGAYVVFGSAAGFAASIDLASLDDATGFRLDGIADHDYTGRSVAGAGDVNGDGIDDLVIGAPGATYDAGESYVVFGSARLGGINDAPSAADDVLRVGGFDTVDLAADNGEGLDRDPDLSDLTITAIDGVPVAAGESVTIASGVRVIFLGGTEVQFDAPGVAFATALSDSFVYEVSDRLGAKDSATVSVNYAQNAIQLALVDGTDGFRLDGTSDSGRSFGSSVARRGGRQRRRPRRRDRRGPIYRFG